MQYYINWLIIYYKITIIDYKKNELAKLWKLYTKLHELILIYKLSIYIHKQKSYGRINVHDYNCEFAVLYSLAIFKDSV